MRAFLCVLALVAAGAGSWATVQRLDPGALAVAVALGVALGVGLPLCLAVLLLWRATQRQSDPAPMAERYDPAPVSYTRPQVMIIPPMALPNGRQQQQASWAEAPGARRYTVIGDDAEG